MDFDTVKVNGRCDFLFFIFVNSRYELETTQTQSSYYLILFFSQSKDCYYKKHRRRKKQNNPFRFKFQLIETFFFLFLTHSLDGVKMTRE